MSIGDTYNRLTQPIWRSLIRYRAHDETAASATRSALVVAPHPDDETFGCGATIARRAAAGTDVWVVIAADGRHARSGSSRISALELAGLRRAEAVAACAALGVPEDRVIQLGIEDTHVEFAYDRLVTELRELLLTHEPDDVFTTSERDWHIDHRSVSHATRTAAASTGRLSILEYPIWWWIDGPRLHQPGHRRLGRALHGLAAPWESPLTLQAVGLDTNGFIDSKRAAIAAHATQVSNYTDEPDWYVIDAKALDLFCGRQEIFLRIDRLDGLRLS